MSQVCLMQTRAKSSQNSTGTVEFCLQNQLWTHGELHQLEKCIPSGGGAAHSLGEGGVETGHRFLGGGKGGISHSKNELVIVQSTMLLS